MGWDRKANGAKTGYFYRSVRVPGKPHPVKIYCGRGEAGQRAAEELQRAAKERQEMRDAVRAEQAVTANAEKLWNDLEELALLLSSAWLIATGHHNHRGEWRFRHGEKTQGLFS